MLKIPVLFVIVFICNVANFAQDGRLSGKVTYGDNVALHGAQVEIAQTKQSAQTDENGNFEITGVAPGRYTIIVHLEGFSDSSQTVDVAAGVSMTLNVRLQIASLKE